MGLRTQVWFLTNEGGQVCYATKLCLQTHGRRFGGAAELHVPLRRRGAGWPYSIHHLQGQLPVVVLILPLVEQLFGPGGIHGGVDGGMAPRNASLFE